MRRDLAVAHVALTVDHNVSLPPTPRRRAHRHRAYRSVAAVTTSLASLALLSGCGVFDSGNTVAILGDSITVLSADAITKAVNGDFEVESTADWGVRIDEQIDPGASIADDDPVQVVVNLGTNNVLQDYDVVASAEDLAALLDQFDGADCIHLVTVNEQMSRPGLDLKPKAIALNEEIRRLAARRLDTDVIDWNQIIADHAGESILDADTIHPNAAGVALIAEAYRSSIASC